MRFATFLIASVLFATPVAAQSIGGIATVTDGDTIRIGDERIRLFGIDAPELDQTCAMPDGARFRCGEEAAAFLGAYVGAVPVSCVGSGRDDYGRLLAVCRAEGAPQTMNEAMVLAGLAWGYVVYSAEYVDEEARARATGVGIWQAPTMPAWEYRAAQRATIVAEQPRPPGDCLIKGNISRDGERIYHVPGRLSYAGTVIRVEQGERWFCSEAEALEAGWKAPAGP